MDVEEIRKLIDKTDPRDWEEATKNLDIDSEELTRLVEEYTQKYHNSEQKLIDKKIRRAAWILVTIWLFFGFLIYYFLFLSYKIFSISQLEWFFAMFIISFIFTVITCAWKIEKNMKKSKI